MRTSSNADLIGMRFSRLVVIAFSHTERGRWWVCRCDCGALTKVPTRNLNYGSSRSCGCLQLDIVSKGKHRLVHTSEYRCWARILQKCRNPKTKEFRIYGGRGIMVCDRWLKFENFISDMGRKPSPKHSIDRIDNNGSYEPANCRWATRSEQDRNLRKNVYVTAFGRTQIVSDWAREAGVKSDTIVYRLARGMSPEQAVSSQHYKRGQVRR